MDPLFWDISNEYPPIEPLIEGAPSPIVNDGAKLYVSNGAVWEYAHGGGDKTWKKMPSQPPASIKMVATVTSAISTNYKLFALGWNGNLYQYFNGWSRVPGDPGGWERLYGAVDKLFAGTGEGTIQSYGGAFASLTGNIPGGLLTGAAKTTDYYISTMPKWGTENAGIFRVTSGNVSTGEKGGTVKGIIASGTNVIAVATDRVLYGTNFINTLSGGVDFTGGMALWEHSGQKILLLGLQRGGGSYSYGYREVPLDGSGAITSGGIYVPGDNSGGRATTIDPNTRETAAIGKHPVTALAVIPSSDSGDGAGRPITLASTQKNGLWSYRVRDGSPQWNGEDNGN
jgi:hypothetical protein